MNEQQQEYDDLLPACLHKDKAGRWHLLNRHNDEIATFDPAIEMEDMERLLAAINKRQMSEHPQEWTPEMVKMTNTNENDRSKT